MSDLVPQDYASSILAKIDAILPMDGLDDDELAEIENDPDAAVPVDKMRDDDRVEVLDTVTAGRGPGMHFFSSFYLLCSRFQLQNL